MPWTSSAAWWGVGQTRLLRFDIKLDFLLVKWHTVNKFLL